MANLDKVYDIDNRYTAFENHENGILVSIAGPGTGKTFSFLRRINTLINNRKVDPKSICYLTFIKEIANAFISDYQEEFGINNNLLRHPRISTLHSFACRIIRNMGFKIGYDGPLYFASIADKNLYASKIFMNIKTIVQLRNELEAVKNKWQNCVNPKEFNSLVQEEFNACLSLARAYRLIDWDQAIPLAHNLYLDPRNRLRWITELQHFLIDEYQDFNKAEQAFIISIANNVSSMVVVGDDDQSIYSNRGGSPIGLRKLFASENFDKVTLVKSLRCKSNICKVANKFLSSMRQNPYSMIPVESGGEVKCHRFKSSKAEITFLSEFLQNCIDQLSDIPRSKDGIMCLFPTRKALNFYYDNLSHKVPCNTRNPEVDQNRKRMMQFMELVCQPNQRFIERLILEEKLFNAIKPRHKRVLVELILKEDISFIEGMQILLNNGSLSGDAKKAAKHYISFCNSLSSQDPVRITEIISSYTQLDPADLLIHVKNFLESIELLEQDENISRFCDNVLPDTAIPLEDPKSVLFLTFHGSKGLTKHTVVMPGLENAWLPGTSHGEEYEERKRLFYIGLTRATDNVLFTFPNNRARGDPLNYNVPGRGIPCRFIGESGLKCWYFDK
jgi:DNA helicase-2/ATP-dependent DNA helicase PcrA